MQAIDTGGFLPVRAVILDYGEVMSRAPEPQALGRMAAIFRVNPELFFERYLQKRGPYDQGMVTATEYWTTMATGAGVTIDEKQIEQLRRWDTEMWSCINGEMTVWLKKLHAAGFGTALLSNMQVDMAAHARRTFEWLKHFDHQVFSCEVQAIKPDLAIYKHCLQRLRTQSEEVLFIDDREPNVEAALAMGMRAIRFRSVEQLRAELEAIGFAILPPDSSYRPAGL